MSHVPAAGGGQVRGWLDRLAVARTQLVELRPSFANMLSSPDPATGERWTGAQIAAHIAEIMPYWLGETDKIIKAGGQRPAVGRTKRAPERLEAVARASHQDLESLLTDMLTQVDRAVESLSHLCLADLDREGEHITRGTVTAKTLIEIFVVDHLEEHVEQAREAVQSTGS